MTEILGLGLDLIDLQHFAIHYGDNDPELLARCFTDREILEAGDGVDRIARLAGRFAVKEATFKALGGASGISHCDIESVSGHDAPQIYLTGRAHKLAKERGAATFLVSISHSGLSAAAVVIACGEPT
ncbi:holo-ACP synthase [Erythrobacter sp. QSSC1-22B]|uniref:holo-ACP synthase n=1 Tax=Erythrobacter sp. QSSC1-22B TaxID=1860125 RepID=UPI0009F58A59|nr:4'-phosphopantetheinyl transferase superfamily protein [Erythrobacter sp. QSSC1-22B]